MRALPLPVPCALCPMPLLLLQQRAGPDRAGRIECCLTRVDVTEDALIVDDERESPGEAGVLVQNPERLGIVLTGIAQERKVHLHLLTEGQVGPGRVHAHAKDRGVVGVELRVVVPYRDISVVQPRRERRREESEHDHLLALEVGEFRGLRLRAFAMGAGSR